MHCNMQWLWQVFYIVTSDVASYWTASQPSKLASFGGNKDISQRNFSHKISRKEKCQMNNSKWKWLSWEHSTSHSLKFSTWHCTLGDRDTTLNNSACLNIAHSTARNSSIGIIAIQYKLWKWAQDCYARLCDTCRFSWWGQLEFVTVAHG